MEKTNNNFTKKKIAIVIDKEGWAYSNTSNQIKKNLSQYYDIDIIPIDIFGDNVVKLFILVSTYDLVFFMWRALISWLYSDYSKKLMKDLGFSFEEFIKKYLKEKNIIAGVYDQLFLNAEKERTDFILSNVKGYMVCSQRLKEIYDKFEKKPKMVISHGVDLQLFKMVDKNKYDNLGNRTLKIGWTGNSKFLDEKDDDLKGVQKVIKPAIEELINENYNIELKIADRNIKMLPHDEMYKYYNEIDIYVCASRTEGIPNTILEAMACGVPVISTDVGIVPEVLGKKQKEFIIERTKDDLKNKIKELVENKQKLKELSEENLQQIRGWSWEEKTKQYKAFFDSFL